MAAALAYYARRERRRRMFLKHVRHALRRFTDRVMTSPQLSPRLSSSRFFFSLSTTLYLSRGDSCPPCRIIERGQRPVGSVHVSHMHGGRVIVVFTIHASI